jgi:hypothetical protein
VAVHLDDTCYRGSDGGRGGGSARSGGGSERGGRDWIIRRSTRSAEGNTVGTLSLTAIAEMRSGVLEFAPAKGSTRLPSPGRSPARGASCWGPHVGARAGQGQCREQARVHVVELHAGDVLRAEEHR